MTPADLAKFVSGSLAGHLVFFELVFALPCVIYGLVSNHMDGTLTPLFALEMALEVAILTTIGAAAVWYLITLPIKRAKQ
jgi:hypothetical protein